MALQTLAALTIFSKGTRLVASATTTASAADTVTVPHAKAIFGLFVYDTGSGYDVTPVTVSSGTGTIGAGPTAKAGTIYFWGY